MTYRIALVDDDRNILTSVSMALDAEGFVVDAYDNGVDALKGFEEKIPDLAVFDVKMPHMDGIELIQKFRMFSNNPVIFLTSVADEVDQVLGLRAGADDYVTKPFSQRVLIERIRGLLRRVSADKPNETDDCDKIIIGDLILDHARHLCVWKQEPLSLTVTEYLLIKALAGRPGHVKSRDQLIDAAYGESIYVDDRTIDSHIKRVRKKFKKIDKDFDRIETLYGVGYRYKDDT